MNYSAHPWVFSIHGKGQSHWCVGWLPNGWTKWHQKFGHFFFGTTQLSVAIRTCLWWHRMRDGLPMDISNCRCSKPHRISLPGQIAVEPSRRLHGLVTIWNPFPPLGAPTRTLIYMEYLITPSCIRRRPLELPETKSNLWSSKATILTHHENNVALKGSHLPNSFTNRGRASQHWRF